MSGRGKGKAAGTKSVSRSSKAGLQVSHCHLLMISCAHVLLHYMIFWQKTQQSAQANNGTENRFSLRGVTDSLFSYEVAHIAVREDIDLCCGVSAMTAHVDHAIVTGFSDYIMLCLRHKMKSVSLIKKALLCAVPSWPCGSLLEEGQVCYKDWSWSTSLLSSCAGVLVCWDPWAGRQCSQGQQEDQNCAQTHSTCSQEWWGVEQAAWQSHHRLWRCLAKYPCSPSAQEGCQERRVNTHKSNNTWWF